jgi:hypothetical protein
MSSNRYDNFTKEDCIKWKKDKTKNPQTGRELKDTSIILKKLEKICNSYIDNINEKKKQSPNQSPKEGPKQSSKKSPKEGSKQSPKTNKEIDDKIKKYKKILGDEILTDEEIDKLNEKIEKLMKIKKTDIYHEFLSKNECSNWFKNKLRNPRTNILIEKDKVLYKEIEKQCEKFKDNKKSILEKELTEYECEKWFENEKINPRTNLELKEIDKSYGIIKKQCEMYKYKNKEKIKLENINKDIILEEDNIDNDNIYYPNLDDSKFVEKINNLYEFFIHKIKKYKGI